MLLETEPTPRRVVGQIPEKDRGASNARVPGPRRTPVRLRTRCSRRELIVPPRGQRHPLKGVGGADEWHFDLGRAFRHLAFDLGAGLGPPAVVVAPPLLPA